MHFNDANQIRGKQGLLVLGDSHAVQQLDTALKVMYIKKHIFVSLSSYSPCALNLVPIAEPRVQEAKKGTGTSAVFIARNRFAVMDKSANEILVKNLRNEITKKTPAPVPGTDNLFYAGTGSLLCRAEDKVNTSQEYSTIFAERVLLCLHGF